MSENIVVTRPIFPKPKNVQWNRGIYEFGTDVTMYCNMDDERKLQMMQELWSRFTMGKSTLHVQSSDALPEYCAIISDTGFKTNPKLTAGFEYTINVTNDGFELAASDAVGLMHAFFTALQLFNPNCLDDGNESFTVPCVNINDHPELPFRGIHLCVFPETSLLLLEKAMKLAAFMKFTHIVLEFWGTLRFDVLDELAWKNRSFTKGEISPLIKAVQDMGVQVIPMFNHLGHASASRERGGRHVVLNQNPKHAMLFEPDGWAWCLSNPRTVDLLKSIRGEMIDLCGPGDYFFIGCDEAYSYPTCDRCRQKDGPTMLGDYINSISNEMKKEGRRVIMWGDALLHKDEWEAPYKATGEMIPQILPLLSRDIIIADWQYNVDDSAVSTSKYFIDQGFDTLLCPWNKLGNIEALTRGAKELNTFGVLATTWHLLPQFIPTITTSAMMMWSLEFNRVRSTQTAGLMRKLILTDTYGDSGWISQEVDY